MLSSKNDGCFCLQPPGCQISYEPAVIYLFVSTTENEALVFLLTAGFRFWLFPFCIMAKESIFSIYDTLFAISTKFYVVPLGMNHGLADDLRQVPVFGNGTSRFRGRADTQKLTGLLSGVALTGIRPWLCRHGYGHYVTLEPPRTGGIPKIPHIRQFFACPFKKQRGPRTLLTLLHARIPKAFHINLLMSSLGKDAPTSFPYIYFWKCWDLKSSNAISITGPKLSSENEYRQSIQCFNILLW